MVRKGDIVYRSDECNRPENTGRALKNPVVVLERLNIPLNSSVLVRGGTIVCLGASPPSKDSHEGKITNISVSDDYNSEDEKFQEIVKRFQSTQGDSKHKQTEPFDSTELVPLKQASSSSRTCRPINTVTASASYKKNIAQRNVLRRRSMQMSNTSGRIRKYEVHKKHILMRNAAPKLFDPEFAEMELERKIESAGFLNMSNVDKESAVPKKMSTVSRSRITSSKNNSKVDPKSSKTIKTQAINADQTVKDGTAQDTTAALEDNVSPNQNVDRAGNKNLAHHNETISADNISDITPSRISERIKNKKVKFSALKLLAGADILVKKRDSNSQKQSMPKKILNKTQARNASDINANNSKISPMSNEELLAALSDPPVNESESNRLASKVSPTSTKFEEPNTKEGSTAIKAASTGNRKLLVKDSEDNLQDDHNLTSNENVSNEQIVKSGVTENLSGAETVNSNESKLNGSRDILIKSPSGQDNTNVKRLGDKIKVQLKGAPEKRIVNISVAPSKEPLKNQDSRKNDFKQKLGMGLGPDIIIRRVRSEKKQVNDSVEENRVTGESNTDQTNVKDRLNSEEAPVSKNILISNNLIIKNLIYSDNSSKAAPKSMEDVEVPPQIKKLLVEASKNKKPVPPKCTTTKVNPINKPSNEDIGQKNDNFQLFASKKKKRILELKKIGIKPNHDREKLKAKSRSEVLQNKHKNNLTPRKNSEVQSDSDPEPEITELHDSSLEEDDVIKESDDRSSKINSFQNKDAKSGENKNFNDSETFSTNVGKKTAKVTPLRQVNKVPPRSELNKLSNTDKMKISNEEHLKFQNSNTISSSPAELSVLGGKRNYRNAFEKYFISTSKICEHNDSLDSDSSDDIEFLSHFVDVRRKVIEDSDECIIITDDLTDSSRLERNDEEMNTKNQVTTDPCSRITEEKRDDTVKSANGTINEIVKGVTADLPKWNWHMLPESSVVCLVLLDREPTGGTLDVKKCIEIDNNFKANVYVNKEKVNEYCGIYDSFDAIKNLIYQVDLL